MPENELVLRLMLLLSGILLILVMLLRARLLAGRPRGGAGRAGHRAEPGGLACAHLELGAAAEHRGRGGAGLVETHGLE